MAALSNMGRSHLKRKHDVLTKASLPSQPEPIAEESRPLKKFDSGKAKMSKLSTRYLEILAAFSEKRISITDIEFSETRPQDGGTFADVTVATLIITSPNRQERRVAVKKLRLISYMTLEKFFLGFVNELRVLDQLSHPNIIKIIGFVEDIENRIAWLVFPWEDNGNLRQFLRSGTWELPERVSLIQGVALGVEHLHTRQPPICHGDLKSLNILVNSSNRAVIADFGSARIVELGATSVPQLTASATQHQSKRDEHAELKITVSNTTLTLTGPACSVRWAPPEYFNGDALNLASDIWALGWIAWEAITDYYPFEELHSEVDVLMRVLEGQLPTIYDNVQLSQIHRLCGVMQKCWNPEPRERPSATECRKAIAWIPQVIPSTKSGDPSAIQSARLLMQTGEIHRLQNRPEEALRMFEQGLAIAQSTGDKITLADLLVRMAQIHQLGSKSVDAEKSFTEALAIYKSIGNERGQADTLNGLGSLRREQSKDIEAEASFAEALGICKNIGYDLGRANALNGLGDVQRQQSRFQEAENSFSEELSISKSIGYDLGRANALKGLGDVWTRQSKYIEAEASYAEVLAICKSIGYDLGRANAFKGIGDVRTRQSRYLEAEKSHAEALKIYKTIGYDLGRANALKGIGDVRRQRSEYIEAEASYAEALAIYQTIGCDLGGANALKGLGDVRTRQSKYIEAEASYAEMLAICKSIGYDLGRANALKGIGDVRTRQSKYIEAEASYAEALMIYKTIGYDLGGANALKGLGDVQRQQTKYTEAGASYADALVICKRIGDSLGRVNSSLGLAKIWLHQARYPEAKALIDDAATISQQLDYRWGIQTSKELLNELLNREKSPVRSSTPASPTPTHAEDSNSPPPPIACHSSNIYIQQHAAPLRQ